MIILGVLILIVLLSGCEQVNLKYLSDEDLSRISEAAVKCGEKYLRVGLECCLDADSDGICDKDKYLLSQRSTPTPVGECEGKYFKTTTGCCLDTNSNSVCDGEEQLETNVFDCEDTDPDQSLFVKGEVKRNGKIYIDQCEGVGVRKYMCAPPVGVGSSIYPCEEGCNNGVCTKKNCEDISDSENNKYVTGEINYLGKTYNDECVGSSVREYSCALGGYGYSDAPCENGCKNGACIESSEPKCEDDDPEQSLIIKGTVNSNSNTYVDTCEGVGVRQFMCSVVGVGSSVYPCEGACGDGVCVVSAPTLCTDSDQEQNIFIKGKVVYASKEYPDECQDSSSVKQYACAAGGYGYSDYLCQYGCADGICLESLCSDTDTQNDVSQKGEVVYQGKSYPDSCKDNSVRQYDCAIGGYGFSDFPCEKGCSDGICIS